jgi:hypothetical protein
MALTLVFSAFAGKLSGQTTPPGAVTVYVFLHPECVISRYVTGALRQLHAQYSEQKVVFLGVFPDQNLTEAELRAFAIRFDLPFELVSDPGLQRTNELGARVTPEVFLVHDDGQVLYRGRVDDRYYKVGGMRPRTSSEDLAQALSDFFSGQLTAPRETQAVGCFIPGALVSDTECASQEHDSAQKVLQP